MTIAESRLPNGLRVVSQRMDGVETVSLGAWVNAGTRHERAEVNGIAHMLEHMAFKGTRTRTARAIAEEIESVGGHLNAYTSREFTAYHATVLAGDEELALDIIADILQRSTFDPGELERERAVIIQEIGQAHDTPDDVIFDQFQETAFPDQPVGRPTLGTTELVSGMARDALVDYLAQNYTADQIVIAAAGKIDHSRFAKSVETLFSGLEPANRSVPEPARYVGGECREDRPLEQLHLVLGLNSVSYNDPRYYPLAVLTTLLGGGSSSRLFQDIREERGLVYSVYAFTSSYQDSGLFGVYAGTGAEEGVEVVALICDHLRRMEDEINDGELQRARAQLKAGILMSMESTASRSDQIARNILIHDRVIPSEEIIERIDAVDRAAIGAVARGLRDSRPTFATIGPADGVPSLSEIEKSLS